MRCQAQVLIATALALVAILTVPGPVMVFGLAVLIGFGLVHLIGPCGNRFFRRPPT